MAKNQKTENKKETVVKKEKVEIKQPEKVEIKQAEKIVYVERPKAKITWLSIVLFVLAAIAFIYSIYVFVGNYSYITGMIAEGGLDMSTEFANVVKYFVDGSATYIIYAVILAVLGVFHNILTAIKNK